MYVDTNASLICVIAAFHDPGLITGKIAAIVNIADHDIRGTKRER